MFNDNPISTTSGKSLSTTEIDQAIIRAGKERDWNITSNGDGTLKARLSVRTHILEVQIRVKSTSYDVVYTDSSNLGYAPNPEDPGRPLIHPAYNKWCRTWWEISTANFPACNPAPRMGMPRVPGYPGLVSPSPALGAVAPNCCAASSMNCAMRTSSSVTPPASCVVSSTSTRL